MMVSRGGIAFQLAVGSSRNHDGNFFFKIERFFSDCRTLAKQTPHIVGLYFRRSGGLAKANLDLAAAVITAARALYEAACSERNNGSLQISLRLDGSKLADRKAMLNQPVLLKNAVLNDPHHGHARTHWSILL